MSISKYIETANWRRLVVQQIKVNKRFEQCKANTLEYIADREVLVNQLPFNFKQQKKIVPSTEKRFFLNSI